MRPLLITDCDEVLLHMVRHFGTWLGDVHDIDFRPDGADFANSMRRRDGSPPPTREEMWALLGGFFPAEMHRQTLVPHAAEALARLSREADIVVLTNLQDECRTARIDQLVRGRAGDGADMLLVGERGSIELRREVAARGPWLALLDRPPLRDPFRQAAVEDRDTARAEASQHPPGARAAMMRRIVVDDDPVPIADPERLHPARELVIGREHAGRRMVAVDDLGADSRVRSPGRRNDAVAALDRPREDPEPVLPRRAAREAGRIGVVFEAGVARRGVLGVRQGHLMATSFHPEVTGDPRIHEYFVSLVREHA